MDDYVLAGSSNLGYKSLETMSDHEINFVAKSKLFANQTAEVIMIDVNHSYRIDHPEKKLSISAICRAAIHRIWAPLIG